MTTPITLNITEEEVATIQRIMKVSLQEDLSADIRTATICEIINNQIENPAFHQGYLTGLFESQKSRDTNKEATKELNVSTLERIQAGEIAISTIREIFQMCNDIKLTTELEERILGMCRDVIQSPNNPKPKNHA
jgi:hypothetical protein